MLRRPRLAVYREYTIFFRIKLPLHEKKLSDKHAIGFPNDAEQGSRIEDELGN